MKILLLIMILHHPHYIQLDRNDDLDKTIIIVSSVEAAAMRCTPISKNPGEYFENHLYEVDTKKGTSVEVIIPEISFL